MIRLVTTILSVIDTRNVRFYHKNVIDHYESPRNVGSFDKKDKNVGTGLVGAPSCGDVLKIQIKVNENIITSACF